VALVGEPGRGGDLGDRRTRRQPAPGLAQPDLAQIGAGRNAVPLLELAVQLEAAQPHGTGEVVGAQVLGEPYQDASGRKYLAMFAQPVLVFVGSAGQLSTAYARAVAHQVRLGIFTEELFGTDNDADNRAAVAAVAADGLRLVGLALHDQRRVVDKVLRGLRLHP
jgi:hypothetical protein